MRNSKWLILLSLFIFLFCGVNAFAQEPEIQLKDAPDLIPDIETVSYADEAELCAMFANTYELLVFTYERPLICRACDIIRPLLEEMSKEYPITMLDVEDEFIQMNMDDWEVKITPTFLLVKRRIDGSGQEIMRWSGIRNLEERIEDAFEQVRFNKKDFKPRPAKLPPCRFPKGDKIGPKGKPGIKPNDPKGKPDRPREMEKPRPWWKFWD